MACILCSCLNFSTRYKFKVYISIYLLILDSIPDVWGKRKGTHWIYESPIHLNSMFFGLWEETGKPGGNSPRQMESIWHRKTSGLNLGLLLRGKFLDLSHWALQKVLLEIQTNCCAVCVGGNCEAYFLCQILGCKNVLLVEKKKEIN